MIRRILSEIFTTQNEKKRSSRTINFSCRFMAGRYVEHEIAGEFLKEQSSPALRAGTESVTRAILLFIAYKEFVDKELDGREPEISEAMPAFVDWLNKSTAPVASGGNK